MSPGAPRLAAVIGITERCNHRCAFCLDEGRHGRRDPPLDEVLANLRTLAGRGVTEAILMTGESVLRPDFPEVLRAMAGLGIRPILTTNGTLLADDRRLRALSALGLRRYNVSIHAVDDATARALSGRPWTGERQRQALQNLDRAAAEGLVDAVYTKTVVTRRNLAHLPEVARTVVDLLPRVPWLTLGFKQVVPAAESHAGLLVPFDQASPVLVQVCDWAAERGVPVVLDGFPPCATPGHEHRCREVRDVLEGLAYVEVRGEGAEADATLCRMHRKAPACADCALDPLCCGADGRVLAVTGGPLRPVERDPLAVAEAWAASLTDLEGRAAPAPDPEAWRARTRRPTLAEAPLPRMPKARDPALAALAAWLGKGVDIGGLRAEACRLDADRLEVDLRGPRGTVTAWAGPAGDGECLARTPGHRLGYSAAQGADAAAAVRALAAVLQRLEEAVAGRPPHFSS